jgi:hypothetical protein
LQELISDRSGVELSANYDSIPSFPVECSEQYVGGCLNVALFFINLKAVARTVCYPTNGRLL